MSAPRQDDTERDAWLSEALRHAPDAQAAPPPALSDAILREARAATNSVRVPISSSASRSWGTLWAWLARPPVAAGFAGVMVATLIGLMWWDEPMDQTIARPPAVGATAPPMAAEPRPAAPVAVPDEAPRGAAKSEAEPAAPRKLAAPKPTPERIEPNPARRDPPAPEREGPAPFADQRATADAAPTAPAVPPAPVVAAPAAPVLALRARESAPSAAAESRVEAARDESRALNAPDALTRSAAAKAAAPAPRRTEDVDNARPAAFDALLASIAAQPERWGWERDGTVRPMQPMQPMLQRWLARADAATATRRWHSQADAASSGEIAVLRLYRDGTLAATLRLDDGSIGLVPGPRAALPPAALAALKQALDDATR